MSSIPDDIKKVLIDAEHFLNYTLAAINLPPSSQEKKISILSQFDKLWEKYSLLSQKEFSDNVSGGSLGKLSNSSGGHDEVDESVSEDIQSIAALDLLNASHAGWLQKRAKAGTIKVGTYQKRWCILKGNNFYYYTKPADKKQSGAFCISGYEFEDAPYLITKEKDSLKRELSFQINRPGKRVFQFVANSKSEYDEWREAITKASKIPERTATSVARNGAEQPMQPELFGDFNDDEIYDSIDEKLKPSPAVQDEIYDDCSQPDFPPPNPSPDVGKSSTKKANSEPIYKKSLPSIPNKNEQDSQDLYDNCFTPNPQPPPSVNRKKNTENLGPPPTPPTRSEPIYSKKDPLPALPSRKDKPHANISEPQELYDDASSLKVVYPDFTKWRLNDEQDYENMYYGRWDCESERADELSFKHGDMLHVMSKEYDSQGWWIARLKDNFGLVPKNFLVQAYQLVA